MATEIRRPPLTEPKPVDCHFLEGITIEVRDQSIRIVGWVDLETSSLTIPERRIVMRASMPLSVARGLIVDLRRSLPRGH